MFNINTKNNSEKIEWIKPVAFLKEYPMMIKMIAELPNNRYSFIDPPLYQFKKIIPRYIYEASVAKYGYKLFLLTKKLYNYKGLSVFLSNLNKISQQ